MSQKKAWFLKHALQGMNYVLSYLKVFIAYISLNLWNQQLSSESKKAWNSDTLLHILKCHS